MKAKEERESKMFWAVGDFYVKQVKGWSCKPSNPDMWWCPEVGFSGAEGQSLFATQKQALKKAISNLEKDLQSMTTQLVQLKQELKSTP